MKKRGTKANREGMARYAIVAEKVFGDSVVDIRRLGKTLGVRHDLAEPLWNTGWYEARMLVAFVDDPARVTPAQMDRWARDFDNWAVCDHLTFHLFDRTPHAWRKVDQWSCEGREFVKRAAFALLASVALHDKHDLTRGSSSAWRSSSARRPTRNFVKKGVSWALRGVGSRNVALNRLAHVARRLAASKDAPARWVGKDALRDLFLASADCGPRAQRSPRRPRPEKGVWGVADGNQRPPVTSMKVPVVSPTRRRAATGRPGHFLGLAAAAHRTTALTRSTRPGSPPLAWISVWMPGRTAFTRMPSWATSRARPMVRVSMAPLEAA